MTKHKPAIENAKAAPLDTKAANASLNDEINKATAVQSQVTPEDYPAAEREAQVNAGAGLGTVKKRRR